MQAILIQRTNESLIIEEFKGRAGTDVAILMQRTNKSLMIEEFRGSKSVLGVFWGRPEGGNPRFQSPTAGLGVVLNLSKNMLWEGVWSPARGAITGECSGGALGASTGSDFSTAHERKLDY